MNSLSSQSLLLFTNLLKSVEETFKEQCCVSLLNSISEIVENKTLPLEDVIQPIFTSQLVDMTVSNPFFHKIFSIKVLSENQDNNFTINALFWSRISGFIRSNYSAELRRMQQLNEGLCCSMTCLDAYYDLFFELDCYFKTGKFNFKKFSEEESGDIFSTFLYELQLEERILEKFLPTTFLKLNRLKKTFTLDNFDYFSFPFVREVQKIPDYSLALDESYFSCSKEKMMQIATLIKEAKVKVCLTINRFCDAYFEYFEFFKGICFKEISLKTCYKHLQIFFNRMQNSVIETLHLEFTDGVTGKIVESLETRVKASKKFKITFFNQEESFNSRVARLFQINEIKTLGITKIPYFKLKNFYLTHLKIYQNDCIPTDNELNEYFFYSGFRKKFSLYFSHPCLDLKKKDPVQRIVKLFENYQIEIKIKKDHKVLILSNIFSENKTYNKTLSFIHLLRELSKEIMALKADKKEVSAECLENVRLVYSHAFNFCYHDRNLELIKEITYQFPDIFDSFTKFQFTGEDSNYQLTVNRQIWWQKGFFLIANYSILPKEISIRSLQWLDNAFTKNIEIDEITDPQLKEEVRQSMRILTDKIGNCFQPM